MSEYVIKNIEKLGTSVLRKDALAVLEEGYQAVRTDRVVREQISMKGQDICVNDLSLCLSDFERIFFIGIGKCAVDAAEVIEDIVGDRITDGVVIDVKVGSFKHLRSYLGTHPFPSPQNIEATKEIVSMVNEITERDLVFVVVSGGGSSLLCLPHNIVSEKIQEMTEALWAKGATIGEVNVVRKHISDIQGGQLAKMLFPATVVSFIFSDVPGDDMSIVASGPTILDTSTVMDAEHILAQYDVLTQCRLPDCELVETPKDEKYFEKVKNILLVTNKIALNAMAKKAVALGYQAEIRDTALQGIARNIGAYFASTQNPSGSCYLYGGETTVELSAGHGEGGRNQELALGALKTIPNDVVIVAAASDGWDNTDVAGALVDASVRERANALSINPIEYLERNDSYNFWKKIEGSIITGRTGINVSDFYFVMREKEKK